MLFTPFNGQDYTLNQHRIDIWEYPLTSDTMPLTPLLCADEQARANQFYFKRHQHRFTVARARLRLILANYLSCDPRALRFGYGAQGKPYLLDAPTLQFNLSHSKNLALLAVGETYPLGIDLEFFSARPYGGIGQQVFSKIENHRLKNTIKPLKPLVFFHLWSKKEAFIKACGLGLSYPTKTFDVHPRPLSNESVYDEHHGIYWQLKAFMPTLGCCAALCYQAPIHTIRYHRIPHE